jgi:hypothetical protein
MPMLGFAPLHLLLNVFAIIALLVPGAAMSSTPSPFVVALPNGYYIERDQASQPGIVKRSGTTVLQGPIAAYAVYRHYIAGAVGTWPPRAFSYPNESEFPGSPDARYFILDTESGHLESDLSEEAWRARLSALGIPSSLRIRAPILPE